MLLKQRGFSLVEILIAIAISSATALLIFKVLEESHTGLRTAENREAVNQMHREIVARFSDRGICTHTLVPGVAGAQEEFQIPRLLNDKNEPVLTVPFTQGPVTLGNLMARNFTPQTRRAEIVATYTYRMKAKATTITRIFQAELSYRDDLFVGCVARGSAVMDPQEACDLVIGHDAEGKSYFYDGLCHFGRASCEQSGRSWNQSFQRCDFSEEDIEALRQMICQTLGFNYNGSMCVPTQAHIDAINKLGIGPGQDQAPGQGQGQGQGQGRRQGHDQEHQRGNSAMGRSDSQ
jgi:prepilin-type N-terminal cleavage/methylation domain-containing protein